MHEPSTPDAPSALDERERAELAGLLSQHRPFALLERPHLAWMLERLRRASYPAGTVVLEAGLAPQRLVVLRTGAIQVGFPGLAGGRGLVELGPGDCFPLEELDAGCAAFFSFRAAGDVEVAELEARHFRELLERSAPFREACERRARRLLDKLERVQRAQLAQLDTVMSQAAPQQSSASDLAARVRLARGAPALAAVAQAARDLARRMMAQGVAAAQIAKLLSEMSDRIAERVIDLEVERSAAAGVPFCWIALGSEGRMEQTLCTDQDNGIVFQPPPGVAPDAAREALLPLAARINASLAACGFPLCKGQVMAQNPQWCLTLDEWRDRFARWIERPDPEALLNATIFFDLRGVYGDLQLARDLAEWLAQRAPADRRFLALLAQNALETRPPLGLLGRLTVDRKGDHPGTLDLKRDAVRIFVDAARVLALGAGIATPSTEERLRQAGTRTGVPQGQVDAWLEAFQYVQVLRFRHHDDLARAGRELHNHVDPRTLNALEQRFLVEALRQAKALQDRLARAHRLDGAAG